MSNHVRTIRNVIDGLAFVGIVVASSGAMAAETDYDGRWRLEYACTQNSANNGAPFRSRIELTVQGGAVTAQTTRRNARFNRDEIEQWSGGLSGTSISIRTAGSASDGSSWEYEWSGAASAPAESSITGALFTSVRGVRTQVRNCEGTISLVAPAPLSPGASGTARQREADEIAVRPRAAEEDAARQRTAATALASRQREADEAAVRQRAVEEDAARQRAAATALATRQREADEYAARQRAAEEDVARQRAAVQPQHVAPENALRVDAGATQRASDPQFRRAELREYKNVRVKDHADHNELDIVLYMRKSGGGGVQRSMSGEFVRSGQQPVCVDVRHLSQLEARIPLSRLGPDPKVVRGWLGVADLVALNQATSRAAGLNMPSFGAPLRIGRVNQGSPAAQAGFQDGDIILSIDSQYASAQTFFSHLADSLPGRVVTLEIWRIVRPEERRTDPGPIPREQLRATRNNPDPPTGRKIAVNVTLGERLVDMPNAPTHMASGEFYRGLRLSPPLLFPRDMDLNRDQNPAEIPLHQDFFHDVGALARSVLGRALGTVVTVALHREGNASENCASMLAPRILGSAAEEWIAVTTVPPAALREARAARLRTIQAEQASAEAFVGAMARSAPSGDGALYGALWVGSKTDPAPCVVTPAGEHVPRFGLRVEYVLTSEAFRAEWPGRSRQVRSFESAEALFLHIKSRENRCNLVLGNGATLTAIRTALSRDGAGAQFLPISLTETELMEVQAQAMGFRASGQRSAVDAWHFAREIGGLTPQHVETLFKLGVDTPDAVGEAVVRYEDEHKLGKMRDNVDILIEFLEDERETREKRITIQRLRADRAALALRRATEAQQAHRAAENRRAAEFPFVARIACSIGNTVTAIQSCMSNDGLMTELELKNGGDYRMFKLYDVSQAGTEGSQGLEIDLRRSFDLSIRNASDTLVLTVVVTRREDGREVFRRSAARFGTVRASN